MKIRVIGGGWYGCHLTAAFADAGHDVELHELERELFCGASGAIPARTHLGLHYPRSRLTRQACLDHHRAFMAQYGHLTHGVSVNLYAIAERDSLVDFGTYRQVLEGDVEFVTVDCPDEFGLRNVEGALLTGERHIVVNRAKEHFAVLLADRVRYGVAAFDLDDPRYDLTVDCTFCALHALNVDRYEPCLTVLVSGPTEKAVTIMDGPFPSLYPFDEQAGLSSLTSALYTPITRCKTWHEARSVLDGQARRELTIRANLMLDQMAEYWAASRDLYTIADFRLAIRAMPQSAADARLVDVVRVGERTIRVRAGKIDAIFEAEAIVRAMLPSFASRRSVA